ncbi:uncharacterized protein LOC125508051 [Triticum urartu]|uniref:uncharacterized protein LOC125508051 n=1 Tax=Triticum urartu TaxID=4572 RepID=UPI0020440475|nr:uncharacterized protein LOC125508051 [Triticum urartu]XP_048528570.1 uncharacterized protein LOC125508051 [Triticum urartu]XP_048528571.1 uncharacterized protein LOC125508051 [Triticum urartu]XP_048528572.1 uncharacterized protein LOC125508051 [Triticum urartu]XP_048528573.1 uncharacterized protein LOC125508051 [Triticum urartu]XP_048528574.1 uncharacterized protein LOC125508051 [Triticum urartu]
MLTLLVNGKYEDCSKVGLNPLCKLNPAPEAKSDFWKAKYDHEAAKKARAAAMTAKKKTRRSKKKKKSTAEDLLKLDDDTSESEDDTGASQVGEEEQHESRRQARNDDEPPSVVQQTPQKCQNEEVSRSSGDSSQMQFPAFKTAPGGQAKSKKAEVVKPVEDPLVLAPEPSMPTSPPQTEAPEDPAMTAQSDPPEPSADETTLYPAITEPSSSANPPTTSDTDVLVTGSRFVEPGNPTILAPHTTKQEALEKQKVRFMSPITPISMSMMCCPAISVMCTPVVTRKSGWSSNCS